MSEPRHGDDRGTGASEKESLAERPPSRPHAERLPADHPAYAKILRAHDEALRSGADTYVDPASGLLVLTAGYLAHRGSCCGSGCRHCPYLP